MAEIAVFVFGLVLGSFANVIVLRLNTGESLIFGGSRCFFCGRALKWFELIPVISFFALRAKCRNCGSKISWQYPAVELVSGLLFLILYLQAQPNFKFLIFNFETASFAAVILFFWLLLVISVYDIRHKIIPDHLVYSAIVVALLFLFLGIGILDLLPSIFSGLGLFAFFATLWLVSRGRWMGFGDAKLGLALGLILGWPEALAAVLFSFWAGAIAGIFWVFFARLKNLKVQIPFAPFLFIGGLTAFLLGERIISWYFGLI